MAKMIGCAVVTTKLDYANSVLHGTSVNNLTGYSVFKIHLHVLRWVPAHHPEPQLTVSVSKGSQSTTVFAINCVL
jgi:hypothetical protein